MTRTLLSVEDNRINQVLMVHRMRLFGYDVVEAEDGIEALEIIESGKKIELILLDLSLPKMDGIEFATILKKQPIYREIPIIVVTAHVTGEYKQKVADLGILDYFSKPIDFDSLKNAIEKRLEESSS